MVKGVAAVLLGTTILAGCTSEGACIQTYGDYSDCFDASSDQCGEADYQTFQRGNTCDAAGYSVECEATGNVYLADFDCDVLDTDSAGADTDLGS